MKDDLKQALRAYSQEIWPDIVTFREHLHANPELSFEEHETMAFVTKELKRLDIPYTDQIAGTGVIGFIRGKHLADTPHVVLRADLDALPIQEANEAAYKSTVDGKMHACGHDFHTANLLGVARILKHFEDDLSHPVQLLFQPGEEKAPGGASLMIAQGALKHSPVKGIYGLHVFPEFPAGKVGFKQGLYMASCDEIHIEITGKGGHAAMPHQCIDPIQAGLTTIQTLQSQLYKLCDPKIPMVLSFGVFKAEGATNVIPSTASIKGTFRTMDEEWRAKALKKMQAICKGISEATGANVALNIVKGYPYLENNPELTEELQLKAVDCLGKDNVAELPIRLTAEDFSYYSHEVPACFFRVGVRNDELGIVHGVHNPKFDVDPQALLTSMQVMSLTAFD